MAGFVGGLLGVGGGNLIVPALVALGFDPKKASASTSFVVIFASPSGFLGHATLAGIDYPLLVWTTSGSMVGAALGSWLMSDRLRGPQVKLIIGLVLIAITLKMGWWAEIRRLRAPHGFLVPLRSLFTSLSPIFGFLP